MKRLLMIAVLATAASQVEANCFSRCEERPIYVRECNRPVCEKPEPVCKPKCEKPKCQKSCTPKCEPKCLNQFCARGLSVVPNERGGYACVGNCPKRDSRPRISGPGNY